MNMEGVLSLTLREERKQRMEKTMTKKLKH